jgi:hypothetical protein
MGFLACLAGGKQSLLDAGDMQIVKVGGVGTLFFQCSDVQMFPGNLGYDPINLSLVHLLVSLPWRGDLSRV